MKMDSAAISKKPTVLMILDGVGVRSERAGNAVRNAKTPTLDTLRKEYPFARCLSSGMAVGLPNGQIGNSETGHMNIGAGRIVYQELTRINKEIQDGSFFTNEVLQEAIAHCKHKDSNLHLMGLLSDGGIHSHISHLFALLSMIKQNEPKHVYIHCFMDGRDVAPMSAKDYIYRLQNKMRELGIGEIASVHGRYYAMDRDNNYDRLKQSYAILTKGEGMKAANADDAIRMAYERGESDEFIRPTVIVNGGVPVGTIDDDDAVIFYNFRADRARELTHAFCDDDYRFFKREKQPDVFFACFSDYDPHIENKAVAFEKTALPNTFPEWLSNNGLKFLRIAESEKYAQTTYFFNGGPEEINDTEDWIILKSSKVATYDLKPEMNAYELTDQLIRAIKTDRYDVIMINYANADMLGHTGIEAGTQKAMEVLDECVKRALSVIMEKNGVLLICSDHGNAEQLLTEDGQPYMANTSNPVPVCLVNYEPGYMLREGGCLADIIPTLIETMHMQKPSEMTGKSLLMPKTQ